MITTGGDRRPSRADEHRAYSSLPTTVTCWQQCTRFGTGLAAANLGLRALSLPTLHNREGHARQLATYLQRHPRCNP
jgi:hypothetical protein